MANFPRIFIGNASISRSNSSSPIPWDDVGKRLCEQMLYDGIEMGYRGIDTAFFYGNEEQVGNACQRAIQDRIVKREDLFITTKLWMTHYRRDLVKPAVEGMLKRLKMSYLDLLLLHWPIALKYVSEEETMPGRGSTDWANVHIPLSIDNSIDIHDTIEEIKTLVADGIVRRWGLSNFSDEQVEAILRKHTDCPPSVLQDPLNPYYPLNQRKDLGLIQCSWGTTGGFSNEMFGELVRNPILVSNPVITDIAKKYNTTPYVICYCWALQNGIVPMMGFTESQHLRDNLTALSIKLSTQDMTKIDALKRSDAHLCHIPGNPVRQYYSMDDYHWNP